MIQQLHKNVGVYGIKGIFSNQFWAMASTAIQIPAEDVILKSYYSLIIANLADVANKPKIIPTFMGTVEAVARKNSIPEDAIKAALQMMLEEDYVYQRLERVVFNRSVKIVAPDWKKLVNVNENLSHVRISI